MNDLRTWEAWQNVHQVFELGWWKEALEGGKHYADDALFRDHYAAIKAFIEPFGEIIDIGCGPRPAFVPSTVIDPLAAAYQQFTPPAWWDGVTIHSRPAEERIEGLKGDTIVCWNCLNHLIGWRDVLDNMLAYGLPGARFAISTDFYEPFIGHPGFSRADFMAEIDKRFVINKRRYKISGIDLALMMSAKKC